MQVPVRESGLTKGAGVASKEEDDKLEAELKAAIKAREDAKEVERAGKSPRVRAALRYAARRRGNGKQG
jgi:hypothetical protein